MPNSPILPSTDPELVAIGDMLKELKERRFFGQFTIHFGDGIANQTTTMETHKLPDPRKADRKQLKMPGIEAESKPRRRS